MTRGQRTDSVLLCGKRPTEAGGINKDGPADQWVATIGFPSLNLLWKGSTRRQAHRCTVGRPSADSVTAQSSAFMP
jgi:hypothetical protein